MALYRLRSRWLAHATALAFFSVAALWASRAILDNPAAVVTARHPVRPLWASDLRRNIAQTAYVSRTLTTDPLQIFTGPMCYPVPDSVALGEHMFGEGLLGIPAYLWSDDPVVTFNFIVALRPLIGALGMYALAYCWTGNFAAALIAGFLFGFHPMRLTDLLHPSVVGNEWLPAILLFLHRVFARQRWSDLFAFTGLAALQTLESLYVVLQMALAVGIYGSYLLWRYRGAAWRLLPKLAVAAGLLAGVGTVVFGPYLESRETWNVLQGRSGFPTIPRSVLIGHNYFPGIVLLLLASAGLVDRLRRARTDGGYDPRLVFAVIGLAGVWFVLPPNLPGVEIGTLRQILLPWVPGLDAIRAPGKVFFLVVVALALPAAFGVRAILEGLAPAPRALATVLIAASCVLEVFVPAAAKRSFGHAMPQRAFQVRPDEDDLAAIRDLPPGPVLDLPLTYGKAGSLFISRPVLFGAYHGHRQAVCKASFITRAQRDIEEIADRLPSLAAMRELWALDLRTILFHAQNQTSSRTKAMKLIGALADRDKPPRMVQIAKGSTVHVYRLEAPSVVSRDTRSLSPFASSQKVRPGRRVKLRFAMRSQRSTFRHPDPVEPSDLLVTWRQGDAIVRTTTARALLPLALAPGRKAQVAIDDTAPKTRGVHLVTLTTADDPDHLIGALRVAVEPPDSPPRKSSRSGPQSPSALGSQPFGPSMLHTAGSRIDLPDHAVLLTSLPVPPSTRR